MTLPDRCCEHPARFHDKLPDGRVPSNHAKAMIHVFACGMLVRQAVHDFQQREVGWLALGIVLVLLNALYAWRFLRGAEDDAK